MVQPAGPLVGHQLDARVVGLAEHRRVLLELGREVVLEEPELDRRLGVLQDGEHHDLQESLVQVTRRHRKDVNRFVLLSVCANEHGRQHCQFTKPKAHPKWHVAHLGFGLGGVLLRVLEVAHPLVPHPSVLLGTLLLGPLHLLRRTALDLNREAEP